VSDDPRQAGEPEHDPIAPDPDEAVDPPEPTGPAIRHGFTIVRAELLLLAEDLAVITDELANVRDGTHPWVERVDADLAAVRSSLVRIGEDVAAASVEVSHVLAGVEHLVLLADGGPASAN
jgi:hypothetical protein